jgi:signal transduction histidine kinase/CheY-like chemotaxis protein
MSVLICLTAIIISTFFYVGEVRIFLEREFDALEQDSLFVERSFSIFNRRVKDQIEKLEKHIFNLDRTKIWAESQETSATVFIFDNNKKLVNVVKSRHDSNYDYNSDYLSQDKMRIVRSPIFYASLNNKLVSPALPLIQYSYKSRVGHIAVVYELKNIFKELNRQVLIDKSIILFDNKGAILFHPNLKKYANRANESWYNIQDEFSILKKINFLNENKNQIIKNITNYRGEKYVTVFTKSPVVNFVLYKSRDSIFVKSAGIKKQIFLMTLVMVFAFAFLGWYLTRYLIRDLALITNIADKFIKGERDLFLESKTSDEVGVLSLTLQGLMRQVREREKNLKRSERRIREARDHLEETLSSKNGLLEDLKLEKRKVEKINKDQDELLAIVSHDLKNPLAVIDTSMDIINEEDQESLSETIKDLVRRSKNSARTALGLITDLLDLARLDGEIKIDSDKFYFNELVDVVVDSFFLIKKEKNLILEVHCKDKLDIIGDYGRINQVVTNILGNAVKFLPKGGRVDIYLNKDEGSDLLNVQIIDNGPGIPADKVGSIFDKYEQARAGDRKIGTGLGLAICKKICDLHDGAISVSSVEGEGANFKITLPQASKHVDEDVSNEKSIIIVDELSYNRDRLADEFTKYDWKCLKAKDGAEALFLIKKNPESLVICDMYLPIIDGVQLCKIVQTDFPEVQIILMFDDLSNVTQKFLESLNVSKALLKPVDLKLVSFEIKRIFSSDTKSKRPAVLIDDKVNVEIDEDEDINILVIDDSADMHALFKVLLKSQKDCTLSHALDGEEGIANYKDNNYDFVFIDMNMPGLNGDETIIKIKELEKDYNTHFILLTAESNLDRKDIIEMGFNDYIEKPINKKKILSIVKDN